MNGGAILADISEALELTGCNLFCGDIVQTDATSAWVDQKAYPVFEKWIDSPESAIEAKLYQQIPIHLPARQFSSLRVFKENCQEKGVDWPAEYHLVDRWLENHLGTSERFC